MFRFLTGFVPNCDSPTSDKLFCACTFRGGWGSSLGPGSAQWCQGPLPRAFDNLAQLHKVPDHGVAPERPGDVGGVVDGVDKLELDVGLLVQAEVVEPDEEPVGISVEDDLGVRQRRLVVGVLDDLAPPEDVDRLRHQLLRLKLGQRGRRRGRGSTPGGRICFERITVSVEVCRRIFRIRHNG